MSSSRYVYGWECLIVVLCDTWNLSGDWHSTNFIRYWTSPNRSIDRGRFLIAHHKYKYEEKLQCCCCLLHLYLFTHQSRIVNWLRSAQFRVEAFFCDGLARERETRSPTKNRVKNIIFQFFIVVYSFCWLIV